MNTPTKTEAQQRADEIRVFEQELARLEGEGVLQLTEAQRAAIAAHHQGVLGQLSQSFDIDRDARAKRLSLGMKVASFFGALALAASVFFLFYQFWGLLPVAMQVVILVGAALATFLATVFVRGVDPSGYFSKLAAMVAFACFVLNISMLGQIFSLAPTDRALLPWAAFAFLLAYWCDARLLLVAGILCLVAFLGAETGTWSGMYWLYFSERPENFFPAAAVIFAVPLLVDQGRYGGFAMTYRVFGLLTAFIPMLILANWGRASYLPASRDFIEGSYQVLGFVFAAACVWLGAKRQWNDVVNTGVTFFVIFLYTKFFDWWWHSVPKYVFFFIIALTSVLFLVIFQRLRRSGMLGGAS